MSKNELIAKIEALSEWENIIAEAQAEAEALRDSIKEEMLNNNTEEMEVGEMYYDNHLPWDQTTPAAYKAFDPAIKNKIAVLKTNSAKRIAASSEYGKLLRQIELYRKIRNRKSVSLNETQRRKEYAAEKQLIEETEKIMEESGTAVSGKDKRSSDPVLAEAVNIAADLSQL